MCNDTTVKGNCQTFRAIPNPQTKFLTCGKDKFCMLSAAPDGCKMRISSIYATTRFILHKAIATCGFGIDKDH